MVFSSNKLLTVEKSFKPTVPTDSYHLPVSIFQPCYPSIHGCDSVHSFLTFSKSIINMELTF